MFQEIQTWTAGVRTPTNRSMFWLLPTLSSLLYAITVVGGYFAWRVFHHETADRGSKELDSSASLAGAVIQHAQQLSAESRDEALVRFRNSLSGYLHAQGYNDERMALGQAALGSAVAIGDTKAHLEVLVDDIGWTSHLLGDDRSALENIARAIAVGREATDKDPGSEIALLLQKAYRHSAVIRAIDSLKTSRADLDDARRILETYREAQGNQQRYELESAQLLYAEALCATLNLGLQNTGVLSPTDSKGRQLAKRSLDQVKSSADEFLRLGSFSRYVKALALEERLLEALNKLLEAREVAERRKRAVKKSLWDTQRSVQNIRGG